MKFFTYTVVSSACGFTLAICAESGASAKDRPPEPIENPGECPIDLPVRVASMDSLRHFEGLIGHCPEASIIESPAYRANHPRARYVDDAEEAQSFPAWEIPPHRAPRGNPLDTAPKETALSDPRSDAVPGNGRWARAFASVDGRQVAIVPAPGAFLGGDSATAVSTEGQADVSEEVATVLALRPRSYSTVFDENIATAARAHGVDPLLLHAVIKQESAYRPRVTSHAGARGLMQVMPATGRMMGVRDAAHLYDPDINIAAGARLLRQLWQRFDGNIDLVLAAYNAGEGAVRKYGNAVPPYRETQDYVVKVKANYRALAAESGLAVNF